MTWWPPNFQANIIIKKKKTFYLEIWWPPNFQANIIIKKKKTFYLEIWWPPNYSMLDFEG